MLISHGSVNDKLPNWCASTGVAEVGRVPGTQPFLPGEGDWGMQRDLKQLSRVFKLLNVRKTTIPLPPPKKRSLCIIDVGNSWETSAVSIARYMWFGVCFYSCSSSGPYWIYDGQVLQLSSSLTSSSSKYEKLACLPKSQSGLSVCMYICTHSRTHSVLKLCKKGQVYTR